MFSNEKIYIYQKSKEESLEINRYCQTNNIYIYILKTMLIRWIFEAFATSKSQLMKGVFMINKFSDDKFFTMMQIKLKDFSINKIR